jgi:hypothetical protein
MNNLSLIIGIVILVLSIVLIFVGGWEKFHLQRDENAWLALFIVGWIFFVAGVALIFLGIFSNRKSKVPLSQLSLLTPDGAIPLTTSSLSLTTPSLPLTTPSLPLTTPSLPLSTPSLSLTTPSLPLSNLNKTIDSINLMSKISNIYNLPKSTNSKSKKSTGTIVYDTLENSNYPNSLKGGLFD